jgi:beta-glucosidase
LIKTKPTITIFRMERPPVIPEINAATAALIADFDSENEVIIEMIFGEFKPTGHLPFEVPSSVEAVEKQKEDVPYDSENPLYPFGFGLTY